MARERERERERWSLGSGVAVLEWGGQRRLPFWASADSGGGCRSQLPVAVTMMSAGGSLHTHTQRVDTEERRARVARALAEPRREVHIHIITWEASYRLVTKARGSSDSEVRKETTGRRQAGSRGTRAANLALFRIITRIIITVEFGHGCTLFYFDSSFEV
jgi:hypothetical protein